MQVYTDSNQVCRIVTEVEMAFDLSLAGFEIDESSLDLGQNQFLLGRFVFGRNRTAGFGAIGVCIMLNSKAIGTRFSTESLT